MEVSSRSSRLREPRTRHFSRELPALTRLLAGASGRTTSEAGVAYPVTVFRSCRIFVPRTFLPLVAVETGAPIDALGNSFLAFRGGNYADLEVGQYVLHVAAADGLGGDFAPFEQSTATVLDVGGGRSVRVVPLTVEPQQGLWLMRIDPA